MTRQSVLTIATGALILLLGLWELANEGLLSVCWAFVQGLYAK